MNLSLQITKPTFIGDQFTAQLDLVTGKFYYHSEWGELFATLPYDVAEDIAREIWRECFSRVVLKPSEFVYCNVMKEARNKIQYSGDCLLDVNRPVCHCFNKDGRMCGVGAYNTVTVEPIRSCRDGQVMKVPNMVAGVKQARKENVEEMNRFNCRLDQPNRTRVLMCDKHKKEFDKLDNPSVPIARINYVNSLLTKWGWGERNGYPIRLNTNRNDIELSGTLQRKIEKDSDSPYHNNSYRWRRPSHDYEVDPSKRFHENPNFQRARYVDDNGRSTEYRTLDVSDPWNEDPY